MVQLQTALIFLQIFVVIQERPFPARTRLLTLHAHNFAEVCRNNNFCQCKVKLGFAPMKLDLISLLLTTFRILSPSSGLKTVS